MGALSHIYVDPAIAADSGAGSRADPYGDVEWAIEQTTFDATNGTQVNIKAGTDEILAAELSVAMADTGTSIAWLPTEGAPCIFRGYTAETDDGGIGGLSGGGSVSVYNDPIFDYVCFIDLHCHDTGAAVVLRFDNSGTVINCEIDNTTAAGIEGDNNCTIINSYIHDIGGVGIDIAGGNIQYNFFENGAKEMTVVIVHGGTQGLVIMRNIIKVSDDTRGITVSDNSIACFNSVWCDGGTAEGFMITGARYGIMCANNIAEGFSGAGGVGFNFSHAQGRLTWYDGNVSYNNTQDYRAPGDKTIFGLSDNEVLTESPFTDAANGDFSPVNTGNVKEGSLPGEFGGGQ